MTLHSKLVAAAALAAGLFGLQSALVAQQPQPSGSAQPAQTAQPAAATQTSWDGIYSDAQADRGKTIFAENCAACHGAELAGGDMGPGLAGRDFLTNWNDLSVGDLYDRIRTSMPQNAPGSLKAEQNVDLVAFVLKSNGFPAGSADLPAQGDLLKKINIVATKP